MKIDHADRWTVQEVKECCLLVCIALFFQSSWAIHGFSCRSISKVKPINLLGAIYFHAPCAFNSFNTILWYPALRVYTAEAHGIPAEGQHFFHILCINPFKQKFWQIYSPCFYEQALNVYMHIILATHQSFVKMMRLYTYTFVYMYKTAWQK